MPAHTIDAVSHVVQNAATDTANLLREFVQKTLEKPARKDLAASDLPRLFDKLRETIGTKNDYLTKAEIEKAIGNPDIKGEEAQALVALKRNFQDIAGLKDDGKDTSDRISKGDVALAVKAKEKELVEAMADVGKIVESSKRTLYADNCKPLESICSDVVVQGGIGNCYYFAALASMADCSPRIIADMIADHKDGSFTVTFPNAKPIKVFGPTDAELALFQKPCDKGVWVHVMEKAYGQYCMDDPLYVALRRLRGMEETQIPQLHTDGGSALDAGLRVLTNKSIGWTWSFKGTKALNDDLVDAFKRQVPITADTGLSAKVDNGPATQHVYSVLKYDEKDKVLTVRNPWGNGVPKVKGVTDKGNGVFEITLDAFAAHFTKISYPKK